LLICRFLGSSCKIIFYPDASSVTFVVAIFLPKTSLTREGERATTTLYPRTADNHYRNSGFCRVPDSLPSAFYRALGKKDFTESRTGQSPALGKELIYRVRDTRHRETLGKYCFAKRQTLGKDGARQRTVSGRQPLPRAESQHSAKQILLPSVKYLALGK
jgi:hypothetical protein